MTKPSSDEMLDRMACASMRPIPSPALMPAHVRLGPLPEDLSAVPDRIGAISTLQAYLLSAVPQEDETSKALVCAFAEQIVANAEVFARKQHDYGPGNIASFGEFGVLVRVSDKIARLRNLQGRKAVNEGIGDSWLDLANYGPIAQIVRAGLWPGCDPRHLLAPPEPGSPEDDDS